jgi:hypothetical protein
MQSIAAATVEEEWEQALYLLEAYAGNLFGSPSEATKAVVACLVAIATRVGGKKRSAVLGLLDELSCGRGIDAYTADQRQWLCSAIEELAHGIHIWTSLAESGSLEDAVLCLQLLSYCAVYVPGLESRVTRYLDLCASSRVELREDISAVLTNQKEAKERLLAGGVGNAASSQADPSRDDLPK